MNSCGVNGIDVMTKMTFQQDHYLQLLGLSGAWWPPPEKWSMLSDRMLVTSKSEQHGQTEEMQARGNRLTTT